MQDLKPLLPEVRILCPASTAYVHPHVVLVDAPGVQDANAARGNVVKKLLEDENFFSNSLGFIPTAAVSGSVSRLEVIENDYKLTGYFLTKPFSLPLTTPRSEKQWEKMYSPARPEKPLSSHHHFMDVWCDWNLFYGTIRGTQDDITGIIKLTHFFWGIKFDA